MSETFWLVKLLLEKNYLCSLSASLDCCVAAAAGAAARCGRERLQQSQRENQQDCPLRTGRAPTLWKVSPILRAAVTDIGNDMARRLETALRKEDVRGLLSLPTLQNTACHPTKLGQEHGRSLKCLQWRHGRRKACRVGCARP